MEDIKRIESVQAPSIETSVSNEQKPAMYFTLKDFLTPEEAATFFDWPHWRQVDKVAAYLEFVAKQPAAAQFTSSARASTSWAELRSKRASCRDLQTQDGVDTFDVGVLEELLVGRTRSGFGAFGTEDGYLPQKELSLAVANTIEEIGHEYPIERTKTGEIRPPVLNSRSFYLNWCHAEKQKLIDIRRKLDALVSKNDLHARSCYWERIVVVVDRGMCADCIQYTRSLAAAEHAHIVLEDPAHVRIFPPSQADPIAATPVSR